MSETNDYKKADIPSDMEVTVCKYCGAQAALFKFDSNSSFLKVVCCSNQGDENEGIEPCPLYLPTSDYYKPTRREAILYWNERPLKLRALAESNVEVTNA